MNDNLNNEITKQILDLSSKINHCCGRAMGQENVLKVLNMNGPITQKDLQNRLNVKSGSISEIVSKLEKQGYLIKSKSEKDARLCVLEISEKGKKKLTEIKRKGDIDICDKMSDQEKEELLVLLNKLTISI